MGRGAISVGSVYGSSLAETLELLKEQGNEAPEASVRQDQHMRRETEGFVAAAACLEWMELL